MCSFIKLYSFTELAFYGNQFPEDLPIFINFRDLVLYSTKRLSLQFQHTVTVLKKQGRIIGILAALLLPALSMAKEQAKRISCVNNVKQVSLGVMTYAGTFDGYAPCTARADSFDSTSYAPGTLCNQRNPGMLSYGSLLYGYPMGLLVHEKYLAPGICQCPGRTLKVSYGGGDDHFDTSLWMKQIEGSNEYVVSSYVIKTLRWEDWEANGGNIGLYPYRIGEMSDRAFIAEFHYNISYYDLPNPSDIYVHSKRPRGITVAYEDCSVKFVIQPPSPPQHLTPTYDLFNQLFYYLRKDGEYCGN